MVLSEGARAGRGSSRGWDVVVVGAGVFGAWTAWELRRRGLDRHPFLANALLVGGGSGHGFKHGPALGRYAADLIDGKLAGAEPRFSFLAKTEVQQQVVRQGRHTGSSRRGNPPAHPAVRLPRSLPN